MGSDFDEVLLYALDGRCVATALDLQNHGCEALTVAPTGSTVAALSNGRVLYWNAPTADQLAGQPADQLLKSGPVLYPEATSLAFIPDGGRLVTNGGSVVRVWDVATENVTHTLLHPETFTRTCVAVSPGGRRVAASHGRDISVWPLDADDPPLILAGSKKSRSVRGLAFAPDGGLLAVGSDGIARLWDADAGTERTAWDFGLNNLQSLAVSPDGLTAAVGSHDGHIAVWDL